MVLYNFNILHEIWIDHVEKCDHRLKRYRRMREQGDICGSKWIK